MSIFKYITAFCLLLIFTIEAQAQYAVSLSPAIDTLYSNKSYMFKLENLVKDQRSIDISFDTGFFPGTFIKYISTKYRKDLAIPYIRIKKDGSYNLDYDALVSVGCGRIKGADGDNRSGGNYNMYLTIKKDEHIDTICKKNYYVEFIYDSSLATSTIQKYYCYTDKFPAYPAVSFAGTKLTYQPEAHNYSSDDKDRNINCQPIPIAQILLAIKKKELIKILPANSEFKIVYFSFWDVETKVETDVEKVLSRYSDLFLNLKDKSKEYQPPFVSFTIQLYNSSSGEYLKIPFYKIPIEW